MTGLQEHLSYRCGEIEGHPNAARTLPWKTTIGMVGIDDGIRQWNLFCGQVMVGNHHRNVLFSCSLHPCKCTYPIVHGDDELGTLLTGPFDQCGRKAVPVHYAVRYEKIHIRVHLREEVHQ